MLSLGSLAFASPWLLSALVALPAIWWLLRVTPPAPRRIPFPALRLLLGLAQREETPARTPLWLIVLRTILAALIVIGLAHPLLNPQAPLAGSGPLILVIDDGWAAAGDWQQRQNAALSMLGEAERENRQVVLLTTAPPASGQPAPPLQPVRAADARAALAALAPKPWGVDRKTALARLDALPLSGGTGTVWLSDEVDDGAAEDFAASARGAWRLSLPRRRPWRRAAADRSGRRAGRPRRQGTHGGDQDAGRAAAARRHRARQRRGRRPAGASGHDDRRWGRRRGGDAGNARASCATASPASTSRESNSAGAALLVDERWRRRPVGIAASTNPGNQPPLSETYYLERALDPFTEIRRGPAEELLKRQLALLVYSDAGPDLPAEEEAVRKWVEAGGVLLRFAGPHLAEQEDHLLPVRLRRGGRTIGGALSWEQPAKLAPFAPDSPFAGLVIPPDVTVSRQVLAEPDIELAAKTWARLADGTPLVTGESQGNGWVVLIHTTANASWSNLALSGLFVEMLRRIVGVSEGVAETGEGTLAPYETLDGFGRLQRAAASAGPIAAKDIATAAARRAIRRGSTVPTTARRALNLGVGDRRS